MVEKSYTKQFSQYLGNAAGTTVHLASKAYDDIKDTFINHGEEVKKTAKETYEDVANFSEFSEMVQEDIVMPIENSFASTSKNFKDLTGIASENFDAGVEYVSDFFEDVASGIYEGYQYSTNACESGKECIIENGQKAFNIAEDFVDETKDELELAGEKIVEEVHSEL